MATPTFTITIDSRRFRAVYAALAQWADNERNFVEESNPEDPDIVDLAATVAVVEGVVAEMELQINGGTP
jgi:hypothetical protein